MQWEDHRRFNGKLPHGESWREFVRLARIETDKCVVWPYAKAGQRQYGQVYVGNQKRYAHDLALEVRIGPRPSGLFVLHGPCVSPACMNYRHLRYGTPQENNRDQRRDGTAPIGERNAMSKLTADHVRDVRRRYSAGESQRALAKEFGVSVMTINRAIRGESWNHITTVS